jgi:hypothetical protein
VAPEAAQARSHLVGDLQARGLYHLAQAYQVVAPRAAAEAVQESLEGQLASLLGRETGPVVQSGSGLEAGAL